MQETRIQMEPGRSFAQTNEYHFFYNRLNFGLDTIRWSFDIEDSPTGWYYIL